MILVWALLNIKKDKAGRELRVSVNMDTETPNSRLYTDKVVHCGDCIKSPQFCKLGRKKVRSVVAAGQDPE